MARELEKIVGYKRVMLKSDQEPAILDLKNKLKKVVKIDLVMEETLVGDSQSGGMFENAVKRMQGNARTYKLAVEQRLGLHIPEDHPIMSWLIRHSTANDNRFHVGKDGMTALRRLRGRNFRRKIVEFAECVWYLVPKTKGKDKLKSI